MAAAACWVLVAVLLVALEVPVVDLNVSLAVLGSDPTSVRAVELLRQHGGRTPGEPGRPMVVHRSPAARRGHADQRVARRIGDDRSWAGPGAGPGTPAGVPSYPQPGPTAAAGRGHLSVGVGTAANPAIATALLRPDSVHTSLLAGPARIDSRLARLQRWQDQNSRVVDRPTEVGCLR